MGYHAAQLPVLRFIPSPIFPHLGFPVAGPHFRSVLSHFNHNFRQVPRQVRYDTARPDGDRRIELDEENMMKKLMTLMLGLSLAFTTVAVSFAQETKKETSKKGKSKGGKKKGEETKKSR